MGNRLVVSFSTQLRMEIPICNHPRKLVLKNQPHKNRERRTILWRQAVRLQDTFIASKPAYSNPGITLQPIHLRPLTLLLFALLRVGFCNAN